MTKYGTILIAVIAANGGIKMSELIIIVIIIAIIALLMRVFKSFMTRRTKINLGVIQVLNDGAFVESMDNDIIASSDLPFSGSIKASYFANYLTLRESGYGGNYYGLVSAYLFKWETEGILKTEMTDSVVYLTFDDENKPTEEIELELYEILKSNGIEDGANIDYALLEDWSKKILALGEEELLETEDVAFDQKGRIRFTKQGYYRSLSHRSFEKYFENLTPATFNEMDDQHQLQELGFALLLDFTEEIESIIDPDSEAPELLQIANRVWRVFEEEMRGCEPVALHI